jgi:4-amino-4-deoxy-L-arabinose transferase-like glycosyltransferase
VGIASLLVSVLFFPYIFFAPIVYTDTISLIFLLLPLHILLNKNGEFRSHVFLVVAASILFSLGMLLKGSLVIFLIAFSIVLFLHQKKRKKLYFIIPFIILLIVKLLLNSSIYQFEILDKVNVEQKSMPVTHWIMMGQNKNKFGKYSQDDVVWTKNLLSKYSRVEVSQIHYQELKNRISEKGLMGNISFNIEKIGHTWTDGTYYSLNKLRRIPKNPENFNQLTIHIPGHLVQGYARVQHLMLLIGLLFSLKLKNKNSFVTFAMLSLIGFFIFFIIWETRSRYLVSLTPLIIMVSCMGYIKIFNVNQKGNLNLSDKREPLM